MTHAAMTLQNEKDFMTETRLPDPSLPLLKLMTRIVTAHVAHNPVTADELPALVRAIYAALAGVGTPASETVAAPVPAVPVRQSVFPDYIVCLEDGKKLKMLKRHLGSVYGMTPAQYRERWGLPADYPMVAPSYAERRAVLAREIGLGSRISKASSAVPEEPEMVEGVPVTKLPARRRGRTTTQS